MTETVTIKVAAVSTADRRKTKLVAFRMPVGLLASLDSKARAASTDRTEVLMACLWELVDSGKLPKVSPSVDPRQSVMKL